MESFRLSTQRATVVDLKSFPFAEKDMLEWSQRMKDITKFNGPPEKFLDNMNSGYESLTSEDIEELKLKYDVQIIIFHKPKILPYDKLYENEEYVLYSLY